MNWFIVSSPPQIKRASTSFDNCDDISSDLSYLTKQNLFFNDELEMPPVIQVELIEIAEKTNVPQISKKKEDKKPEKENKKEEQKLNQPIQKPKEEKSNEKVKDPSTEEKIENKKIEEKMIQNMPVR